MVGEVRPRFVPQNLRRMALRVAQVDAVQAQQRHTRRVGTCEVAVVAFERFVQVVAQAQGAIAAQLPVVEVASDDNGCTFGQRLEQPAQQLQLLLAMALQQRQVHADGMHLMRARHIEHAMQQAAALGAGDRHVEVAVLDDRVFRQQGVAVVAVGVYGIAAVGEVAPHAVSEKFVLGRLRPAGVARGMAIVAAEHLLQEHDVGLGTAHRFAQFRQDKAPVEGREALVGVDRQHPQPVHGWGLVNSGETWVAGFELQRGSHKVIIGAV